MAIEYLSQPKYAKLIGKTGQYVGQLINKGIITEKSIKRKGKRNLINPVLANKDLKDNLDYINRKPKKSKTENESKDGKKDTITKKETFSEARLRKEIAVANTKILEYELKAEQVVPADEVKREADFAGRLVKQKVSSWPGRVYALVAAESDPFKCEQILKKECNELLEEISGGL